MNANTSPPSSTATSTAVPSPFTVTVTVTAPPPATESAALEDTTAVKVSVDKPITQPTTPAAIPAPTPTPPLTSSPPEATVGDLPALAATPPEPATQTAPAVTPAATPPAAHRPTATSWLGKWEKWMVPAVIVVILVIVAVVAWKMLHPKGYGEGFISSNGRIYPATHFLIISRGVFSKALGLATLAPSFWPLLAAVPVILGLAVVLLKKQEA